MMNAHDIEVLLDASLPDEKIVTDLRNYLAETENDGNFVFDFPDRQISVPVHAPITIIYKMYTNDNFGVRYSTYDVYISIGDVGKTSSNILVSQYCFARLYYNDEGNLISADVDPDYFTRG